MKGTSEINDLRKPISIHSNNKSSAPSAQGSDHLDLYMPKEEKERLEKEIKVLDKRRKDLQKHEQSRDKGWKTAFFGYQ